MSGFCPFSQPRFRFFSFGIFRSFFELCVRRRVQAIANVSWGQNSAVERLQHDAGAVTGVTLRDGRSLPADFVIDASGRGALTLKAFDEMGYARPRETTIGVDMRYASALFEIPEYATYDWKLLITRPDRPPGSLKGAALSIIEGNRWICGLAWQGEGEASVDRESFIE